MKNINLTLSKVTFLVEVSWRTARDVTSLRMHVTNSVFSTNTLELRKNFTFRIDFPRLFKKLLKKAQKDKHLLWRHPRSVETRWESSQSRSSSLAARWSRARWWRSCKAHVSEELVGWINTRARCEARKALNCQRTFLFLPAFFFTHRSRVTFLSSDSPGQVVAEKVRGQGRVHRLVKGGQPLVQARQAHVEHEGQEINCKTRQC